MIEENKPGMITFIFKVVGLLFLASFTCLGLLYTFKSNMLLSAFVTIVVTIFLAVISSFLVVFKMKKSNIKNKTPEVILLALYLIFAVGSAPFIFHAINIEANKSKIKRAGLDKLVSIKSMQDAYGKAIRDKINNLNADVDKNLTNYFNIFGNKSDAKANLNTLLAAKGENIDNAVSYSDYESPRPSAGVETRIRDQVENLRFKREVFLKSNYNVPSNINKEIADYNDEATDAFENWRFWNVSHYYYDIDNMYNKYYEAAQYRMPDFSYPPVAATTIQLDSPVKSMTSSSIGGILIALGLVVLVHLCILFPYIKAKRPQEHIQKYTGTYEAEGAVKI